MVVTACLSEYHEDLFPAGAHAVRVVTGGVDVKV